MHRLIPFASLFALIIGVLTVMTAAGAFDDDATQTGSEGISAVCAEGFEDCEDTIVVDDGEGGDDAGPLTRDDLTETCLAGATDCNDSGDDAEPLAPPDGGTTEGEALAIEAAFAALEAMGGPPSNEVEVSGVEAVDWNDGCLGVETSGISCIQVITPGFIVFVSGADGDYEFHTDTVGNAVFVPRD
jgi:hypothetical protein